MYFGSGNGCGTFNRSFSDVSNSKKCKKISMLVAIIKETSQKKRQEE
jgi:hypothetical protein